MTEAGWALLGVVVGIVGTGLINWLMQSRQFAHEKQMFQLQNLSAAMVKTVLQEMLNHKSYTDRSFLALNERIGGYSDDQRSEERRVGQECGRWCKSWWS